MRSHRETERWLQRVVQGHFNYYGVLFNSKALIRFVEEVKRRWLRSLCRRGQRNRLTLECCNRLIQRWIPKLPDYFVKLIDKICQLSLQCAISLVALDQSVISLLLGQRDSNARKLAS